MCPGNPTGPFARWTYMANLRLTLLLLLIAVLPLLLVACGGGKGGDGY